MVAALTLSSVVLAACGSESTPVTGPVEEQGPPTSQAVTVSFAPCANSSSTYPWVAYQDGTSGAWKRVTAQNGVFNMPFTNPKGAVAYTEAYGINEYSTDVQYGTVDELRSALTWSCNQYGSNSVDIVGLLAGQQASVSLGFNASYQYGPGTKTANLTAPLANTLLLGTVASADTIRRMILRRGLSAGTLPQAPLDFQSAEAFAPAHGTMQFTGPGAPPQTVNMWLQTVNEGRHQIMSGRQVRNGAVALQGLTSDKLLPGELYEFYAFFPSISLGTVTLNRNYQVYATSIDNVQVDIAAPPAEAPAVTVLSTAGNVRGRLQYTAQPEMKSMSFRVSNNVADLSVMVTRAYAGSNVVDLTTPDFSAVAGWNPLFAPRAGVRTTWSGSDRTWSNAVGGFYETKAAGAVAVTYTFGGVLIP